MNEIGRVLITGATGYLGAAMARGFANAGWEVLANGRSAGKVNSLVDEILDGGGLAVPAVFDVTSEAAVVEFFNGAGIARLNAVVNNAYAGGAGVISTVSAGDYESAILNSVGAAHCVVRSALPLLREARAQGQDANVINVASMYGLVSPDIRVYDSPASTNAPFYGAAKAALVQWTRYAAVEFGPEGIRFNCLTPGPFPNALVKESDPAFVSRLEDKVPLGRVGDASEIVGPALFLASPGASFVNGANLVVDGGWTCW